MKFRAFCFWVHIAFSPRCHVVGKISCCCLSFPVNFESVSGLISLGSFFRVLPLLMSFSCNLGDQFFWDREGVWRPFFITCQYFVGWEINFLGYTEDYATLFWVYYCVTNLILMHCAYRFVLLHLVFTFFFFLVHFPYIRVCVCTYTKKQK